MDNFAIGDHVIVLAVEDDDCIPRPTVKGIVRRAAEMPPEEHIIDYGLPQEPHYGP